MGGAGAPLASPGWHWSPDSVTPRLSGAAGCGSEKGVTVAAATRDQWIIVAKGAVFEHHDDASDSPAEAISWAAWGRGTDWGVPLEELQVNH